MEGVESSQEAGPSLPASSNSSVPTWMRMMLLSSRRAEAACKPPTRRTVRVNSVRVRSHDTAVRGSCVNHSSSAVVSGSSTSSLTRAEVLK